MSAQQTFFSDLPSRQRLANARCVVIAELSNNHNGSLDQALRLIDKVKEAGADAVKLQAYSVDDLIALRGDGPAPEPWASRGYTMRTLYEQAQTPLAWLPALFAHAESLELPIFSSVFGPDGFRALEDVGNPCYKLASLDFGSEALRDLVLATDKPLIRSCHHEHAPIRLADSLTLYCPPGYPQPKPMLGNIRHGYDGYSYHGTDPTVPAFAVAAGATVVEVHVQLDDAPSVLERDVSLTITQLALLVRAVRRAERMLDTEAVA